MSVPINQMSRSPIRPISAPLFRSGSGRFVSGFELRVPSASTRRWVTAHLAGSLVVNLLPVAQVDTRIDPGFIG